MSVPGFLYSEPFPMGEDDTAYRLLTQDHISLTQFEGFPILKIEAEGLMKLARAAFWDVNFLLRTDHLQQVAAILDDEQASENDRYVAYTMLRNAEISSHGILPFCQDTGTAIVFAYKGQQVWSEGKDEEVLS